MTKYVLSKDITCTDALKCGADVLLRIETELGAKIHADTDEETVQGHMSIHHKQGDHTIWVFLYDNDNVHESESKGVTITKTSDRVRQWTLQKSTKETLEGVLDNVTG